MPHIIVKPWPGKSEEQKSLLAKTITRDVMRVLQTSKDSVSVAIEEVAPAAWIEQVYQPDILGHPQRIYKPPGYDASDL